MSNKILADTLERAIILATEAHAGQKTWDGLPYILHPLHLMVQAPTVRLKIIAVLHDVIEDTHVDIKHIWAVLCEKQGWDFTRVLMLLTHDKKDSYEHYIEKMRISDMAIAVKLLDLEHNMDLTRSYVIPKKLAQYVAAHKKLSSFLTHY